MRRTVLSLIAALIIVGSSFAHGLWTLRFTGKDELDAAGARVARIPSEFGDWTSEDLNVSKRQMDQAGASGYLSRRYTSRTTGQVITIMFLCGQTGPLAAHSPTVCFPGS